MRHSIKKTLSTLAALCTVGTLLVSCSGNTAMKYGSSSISENEFRYYLATYKGRYADTYRDFEDTHDYFATEVNDGGTMRTAEDILYSAVLHNVSMTLVSEEMFGEYKLSVPRSVEDTINSYIKDYITEYADGNRNLFNSELGEYGINISMLKDIYIRDEKTAVLFNYLYGDGGVYGVTDADKEAYLNDNYVRVRHIYVNDKYAYATDENGVLEYTSEGVAKTRSLTDEEYAAKRALTDAIESSLAEGGDFEEVYDAFSEDKYYKNGYYLTRDTDFISDVTSSAFELEIGEYTKVDSDYGTHYIMRLEMDEKPWENDDNSDFFTNYNTTVAEYLFTTLIESRIGEVEINTEVTDKYSMESSPTNRRF